MDSKQNDIELATATLARIFDGVCIPLQGNIMVNAVGLDPDDMINGFAKDDMVRGILWSDFVKKETALALTVGDLHEFEYITLDGKKKSHWIRFPFNSSHFFQNQRIDIFCIKLPRKYWKNDHKSIKMIRDIVYERYYNIMTKIVYHLSKDFWYKLWDAVGKLPHTLSDDAVLCLVKDFIQNKSPYIEINHFGQTTIPYIDIIATTTNNLLKKILSKPKPIKLYFDYKKVIKCMKETKILDELNPSKREYKKKKR